MQQHVIHKVLSRRLRELGVEGQHDRAVKLGTDPDYRAHIRSKILAANSVLFEDMGAVRELERFFKEAVASSRLLSS